MGRGQKITFEVTEGRRSIVLFSFVFLLLFFFLARSHTSQASLKWAIKLWSWISGPSASTSWDSRHATMLYVVLASDPKKEQIGLLHAGKTFSQLSCIPGFQPSPPFFLIFWVSWFSSDVYFTRDSRKIEAVLDCGCLGSTSLRESVPLSSMTL